MGKEIESIKLQSVAVCDSITVYRTPETRKYDEQFKSPQELHEKVKGKMPLWNFTGNRGSEDSLSVLLYLSVEAGYFVAVSKENFMEGVSEYGWDDCLSSERIEVRKNKNLGDLVLISEKALKHIERLN